VTLPIAVDVMGSDRGPGEIIAGALEAAEKHGIPILLVGQPDAIGDAGGLEVLAASEVVGMDEEPLTAVRRKRDSSVVRAAEAVRDGVAAAMVSAGNTGAAVASATLRMGRLPRVQRPGIAATLPVPGSIPSVLVDSGANTECAAGWLAQWGQMGAVFASRRFGIAEPRVGLLSIGEEETKGTPLVREAHAILAEADWMTAAGGRFVGNVEGRDVLTDTVDVIVTDGFTGNVVLKTLEGAVKVFADAVVSAMGSTEESRRASAVALPALAPLYRELDPDTYGGAVLLGLTGVCIIGHGQSSARAIRNAVRVAADMVTVDLVGGLRKVVGDPRRVTAATPTAS
jgi:glycerol-3-phosphate acyltransferase PlsX